LTARFALAFLLALTLAAEARADEDEYSAVHTVAVVSTLGGALHWETTGMTRFDYKDEPLRLDWDVDAYVEHAMADALRGHFRVSDKTLPRGLFAGDSTDSPLSRNARSVVAGLADAKGVDAFVVVRPSKLADYELTGIVASHHGGAFGHEMMDLRSSFLVDVFDARSGQRIDYGTANSPIEHAQWGLTERCDESMWADKQASLSALQKAKLVAAIRSVIDKSLPFALSNAKLIELDAARALAEPASNSPGSASCHPL
jgi:hypothetical protein